MTIAQNLTVVRKKIATAAKRCGRDPLAVRLIAVSKTKPAADILEAVEAGQFSFGENYAQELRDKSKELLISHELEWHFIGHLQKNKLKYVLPVATWIHTVDSVELLDEINKKATAPINCLIEVNIAGEGSKSGISPENIFELVEAFSKTHQLALKGLMCMPPISDNAETSRPYFKKLKSLLDEINSRNIYTEKLTELSMGMTQDFEVAIEEGATMVRVGSAIFGGR